MATFIRSGSGEVTQPTDFKYNTVYKSNEKGDGFEINSKIDPTGNGTKAYLYGNYNAVKYRAEYNNDTNKDNVGSIFGDENSVRAPVTIGNVTEIGSFSYNNGNKNNVPQYYNDENSPADNKNESAFIVNNKAVLSLRNENKDDSFDGVSDDNKIDKMGTEEWLKSKGIES